MIFFISLSFFTSILIVVSLFMPSDFLRYKNLRKSISDFQFKKSLFDVLACGQREGVLKKFNPKLLLTFCYYGTTHIAKYKMKKSQVFSASEIEE